MNQISSQLRSGLNGNTKSKQLGEVQSLMSKLEGTNTAVTRGQLKKNGLYERIAL